MRSIHRWLSPCAVAGLVMFGAIALADEEKIPPEKLPERIKSAVNSWFPGAKYRSILKETNGDKVIWDIELTHGGKNHEMDIKDDGTVLEIEHEIAAADLPQAVTRTIEAKYPMFKVKEVMEVNLVDGKKKMRDHFEVIITTADNKSVEVAIKPDGKWKEEPAAEKK